MDRPYGDLTDAELRDLRAAAALAESDEPPFPTSGLRALQRQLTRVERDVPLGAKADARVRVGADGKAIAVQILNCTNDALQDAIVTAFMAASFKPGKRNGVATEMDFPFVVELGRSLAR